MYRFVCDRLALTAEARKRHFEELVPRLCALVTEIRELPNGYTCRFPADAATVALVAEWAGGERRCCPFFEIDIRVEPEKGTLLVALTGAEGTKDFIRSELFRWMKR